MCVLPEMKAKALEYAVDCAIVYTQDEGRKKYPSFSFESLKTLLEGFKGWDVSCSQLHGTVLMVEVIFY